MDDNRAMAHGESRFTTPRQSELLCFAFDKTKCMPLDNIVKICSDFYKEDEILAAREILVDCNLGQRLPKRKGNDRNRATLEDIIKILLNPSVELPTFFAVDISRLPPVDASHCDIAAILREISVLRSEVRAVNSLREEVAQLRSLLQMQSNANSGQFAGVLDDSMRGRQENPLVNQSQKPMFNTVAAQLRSSGGISTTTNVPRKPQIRKPTVGSSVNNLYVKAVNTTRTVSIFVSRLHPETTQKELVDSVESTKGDITVHDIKCEKLVSRYEHLYSSYHVEIRVNADNLKNALSVFMSSEAWPVGVFVRRYFKPKNDGQSNS